VEQILKLDFSDLDKILAMINAIMIYFYLFLVAKMYLDFLVGILLLFTPFNFILIYPQDINAIFHTKMREKLEIEYPNWEKTIHTLHLCDVIINALEFFGCGLILIYIGWHESNPIIATVGGIIALGAEIVIIYFLLQYILTDP